VKPLADGAVIESSDGKVTLVDGGDNQLFAPYLAGRFRESLNLSSMYHTRRKRIVANSSISAVLPSAS
jgi:hypothetical protein